MNSTTQNAKIEAITEKTLVIGIDVGSETHNARAFTWRGIELTKRAFEFSNDEDGFTSFKAWAIDLAQKNDKDVCIVGMEPTGHYWFNLGAFVQANGMKLVHVDPSHVKKTKELDDHNQTKNDHKDPKVIAKLMIEGRYTLPYIPEGIYAEIRSLSNLRYQAQEELTRVKNRLARWFSIYFPNYKDVYRDLGAVSGIMILKVAPLPEDIVRLGADGINKIWREAKLRGAGPKRAKRLYEAAAHSVGSKGSPEAARIELQQLMADYDLYFRREADLRQKAEAKVCEIPYIDKLLEIRGVGIKTVIGFVAEVGDIGRFTDPKQLQKLAGYAIVEDSSGKHKGEKHISYRGRKRLRYVMYEAALGVVREGGEFMIIHQYYTTRPENPLKKMQSLIAVACKLIRIFYVVMTKGVTYDPQRMLKDIQRPKKATA